jgi:diguanylate cyclase (GGDEF)-like protein
VLFDVDKFKSINDQLGHLGGDATLRELAACIKQNLRRQDVFGRYGGEEFGIIMPETDRDPACVCGERLRRAVETHPFGYEGHAYGVTISVGVAAACGDDWTTTREVIHRADANLTRAKQLGRNRLEG